MEPGKLYHVYTHANGFENLFRSDENYRYFLKRYKHFITPIAATWVYCLMPNHIHFLVEVKMEAEIESTFKSSKVYKPKDTNLGGLSETEKRISKQFSNLFNSYTKAYNKMYQRRGSLFIPNFKRAEVTTEDYISNIIVYIHRNPVHHGFAKSMADWAWSSYQAFLTDTPTELKREEVLKWFGNREEFLKFHQLEIDLEKKHP
jgi:putative transposase